MGYVVKMPKLGLEMERGTLLEWYVEEGDTVEAGAVIAEVESEKSIGEIDAREDGVLRMIDLPEGETVPPGTPIGIVAGADEDITEFEAEFESDEDHVEADTDEAAEAPTTSTSDASDTTDEDASAADVKASPKARRRAEELGVDLVEIDGSGPQGAITAGDVEAAGERDDGPSTGSSADATEQVRASPRAKRRAEELGVDLGGVDGSGPQDAITVEDVEAVETDDSPSTVELPDASTGEESTKASGQYRTATLVTDGDAADALVETTGLAANAFDRDVSVLDVLLVAVSSALDDHPTFNATFENETHHLHDRQDVALATNAEGELVRPVLTTVDERAFVDIVETRHEEVEDAAASGVAGGRATFALSNAAECDDVQRLLAPPTVAGLVVNCARRRATPAENGVTLDRVLSLSLAYDPRAVGDGDAEAFLGTLIDRIEAVPELVLQTYR